MSYYFGCSGWYYNHWEGPFYPEGLAKHKWLEFYAKRFNSVEVNATFYHFPFPNMLKGWYNKAPENFKFTLKGNRQITHIKKLKNAKKLINAFYRISDLLKEKLGCILWQFPPSLHLNTKRLDDFCKDLDIKYNNAIEFRHSSWYCKDVYNVLKQNKVIYCIVSAPGLPEDVQLTSKIAYIRFHGKKAWYGSNYSKKELKEWAERIRKLNAKDVYAYFNNDYNAYAVKNCLELKRLLR